MLTTAPKGYSPAYLARQAGVPLPVVATNLGACLAGLTRHPPHEKAPKNNSDVWLTDHDHALVIARLQLAAVHSQLTSLRAHMGTTTTDPAIQPASAMPKPTKEPAMPNKLNLPPISDADDQMISHLGADSPEHLRRLEAISDAVHHVRADGKPVLHDGRVMTHEELLRHLGFEK